MPQTRKEMENIWELLATYRSMDRDGLIESIANHLEFRNVKIGLLQKILMFTEVSLCQSGIGWSSSGMIHSKLTTKRNVNKSIIFHWNI